MKPTFDTVFIPIVASGCFSSPASTAADRDRDRNRNRNRNGNGNGNGNRDRDRGGAAWT